MLEWTAQPQFLEGLADLVRPAPVHFSPDSPFTPQGRDQPQEARLETFGPRAIPNDRLWRDLRQWWLASPRGNTPNWDVAAGCEIENRPGLVLIEAKAHTAELDARGKPLSSNPSEGSESNHLRIRRAIDEARRGWNAVMPTFRISSESHYQLANRLAFTWKLASLGVPVVLVYLGFLGDRGMETSTSERLESDPHWNDVFQEYAREVAPALAFGRRLEIDGTPAWLLVRSRPVLSQSPKLSR